MPSADTITAWLLARPRTFWCDDCISENTGVSPRQQVNQITRGLEHAANYTRMETPCAGCRTIKKCVAYTG